MRRYRIAGQPTGLLEPTAICCNCRLLRRSGIALITVSFQLWKSSLSGSQLSDASGCSAWRCSHRVFTLARSKQVVRG